MMALIHKLRLILAGILIAAGAAAIGQVGGGSGISAPPTRDASLLTTGELADARLSANVPLLDANNVYTGSIPLTISSGAPQSRFTETDGSANNKNWLLVAVSETFTARVYDDGFVANSAFLTVDRTGVNVDSIGLSADSITANGAEVATVEASGSFLATFETACTTSPTMTFDYRVVGGVVVLRPQVSGGSGAKFSCTSDSVTFTAGTDVPAAARPVGDVLIVTHALDNGVNVPACIFLDAGGAMSIHASELALCGASGNWTASGSKGVEFPVMVYPQL